MVVFKTINFHQKNVIIFLTQVHFGRVMDARDIQLRKHRKGHP